MTASGWLRVNLSSLLNEKDSTANFVNAFLAHSVLRSRICVRLFARSHNEIARLK